MSKLAYSIVNCISSKFSSRFSDIEEIVLQFAEMFEPSENNLYIFSDSRTGALFCECHVRAKKLVSLSTIDVPLDPEEQPEYRANRDIAEDHVAFDAMKVDAKGERSFSNIVCEFDLSYDYEHPVKIIGGQHRCVAIKDALDVGVNENHGVKIYFGLDTDQRLDVQIISNINISVSPDLYDRLQETATGPELRDWCQKVGLLETGRDFSAKREPNNLVTVRTIRSFILNFDLGEKVSSERFDDVDTTPVLCKTGKPDPLWDEFRKSHKNIWKNTALEKAGIEFSQLVSAQRKAIEKMRLKDRKIPSVFSEKALNLAIITAWAYTSGVLQTNKVRLQRHYDLKDTKKGDPLNASAMASGRHKSDPENYRGLATRNDAKEMGRCVELFYAQAENGNGINSALVDLAIKKYHLKQDKLDITEVEKRVKHG